MFFKKALAFIKRDFLVEISYRFSFLLNLFSILFWVVTFFFISKLFGESAAPYLKNYGGEYFPFVLIGLAFSTYLGVGLQSFSGSIRREQMMGTLEAMLLTPTKISVLVVSLSLWSFIRTSLNVLVYLLLGVFLFKVSLNLTHLLPAFIILILTIISFSSLGIIAAGFIIVFKRGNPITWLFTTLSILLGGVYYPISILPPPLQRLSHLLPITYSLRGIRNSLLGDPSWGALLPNIMALAIFSVILLPLGILVFNYAIKKAKKDGSPIQY